MNVDSHLDQLRQRHAGLKEAIRQEERHPGADHVKISALKREKLHLKEEIERLSSTLTH